MRRTLSRVIEQQLLHSEDLKTLTSLAPWPLCSLEQKLTGWGQKSKEIKIFEIESPKNPVMSRKV